MTQSLDTYAIDSKAWLASTRLIQLTRDISRGATYAAVHVASTQVLQAMGEEIYAQFAEAKEIIEELDQFEGDWQYVFKDLLMICDNHIEDEMESLSNTLAEHEVVLNVD